MKKESIYLQRYATPTIGLANQISTNPDMIVVIPAHREENLDKALQALHSCSPPSGRVAILVVINEAEDASLEIQQENKASYHRAKQVPVTYEQHIVHITLPPKKAGVGLARKTGMDEAVRFFESVQKDGIIICYDADCLCQTNYLQEIELFYNHPKHNLGLVHYEHQTERLNHDAIVNYELYLRYYIDALRISHYPFAVQTLGSCITVRSSAYQKQGGMNQRKAGEDFYFIHKLTPLGGIGEINTTAILPSDRVSTRVPFGTGHAVQKYLSEKNDDYPVYHPKTFEDLQWVNAHLKELFDTRKGHSNEMPKSLIAFYEETGFEMALQNILHQAGSFENFTQRYYQWWDGFRILKYVHFTRDQFYQPVPLSTALNWLSNKLKLTHFPKTKKDQLMVLRNHDKNTPFYIN